MDMCYSKFGAISIASFKTITLDEFSPRLECLKGLASMSQKILFERKNSLWLETDWRPENLYTAILKAFDDEIVKMKSR